MRQIDLGGHIGQVRASGAEAEAGERPPVYPGLKIQADRITAASDRHSHNPIRREAALDREPIAITWLGGRRLVFAFRGSGQL